MVKLRTLLISPRNMSFVGWEIGSIHSPILMGQLLNFLGNGVVNLGYRGRKDFPENSAVFLAKIVLQLFLVSN